MALLEGQPTNISDAISNKTLEDILVSQQDHTVLLSDIRAAAETRTKHDEKAAEQLTKLVTAARATADITKSQLQQSKSSSQTLRILHDNTASNNAVIAKRQTSVLTNLASTINTGMNVVNQKMFIAIESLSKSIVGAFASVGRGIENKFYQMTGAFGTMLKPFITVAKSIGSIILKTISMPLKALWEGFKLFNNTLLGKITTFLLSMYVIRKVLTSTEIGRHISDWITEKKNDQSSWIGGIFRKIDTIITWSEAVLGILITLRTIALASTIYNNFRGGPMSMPMRGGLGRLFGMGGLAATGGGAMYMSRHGGIGGTSVAAKPHFAYNNMGATGGVARSEAYLMSQGMSRADINKMAPMQRVHAANNMYNAKMGVTSPTMNASKWTRFKPRVTPGSFVKGAGVGMLGEIAGMGLDYAADNVENKTASGWLNVAGGAARGAGLGAAVGSIIPGIGTAIGAGVGALCGAAYELIAGEAHDKLFGDDNEVSELADMEEQQANATNASISAVTTLTSVIQETNQLLTKVTKVMPTDTHNIQTTQENKAAETAKLTSMQAITKAVENMSSAVEEIKGKLNELIANKSANQGIINVTAGYTPTVS